MNRKYNTNSSNLDDSIYEKNLSSNELYVLEVICNPDLGVNLGFTYDCDKKELIEKFALDFEISTQAMKRIFSKLEKLNLLTIAETKVCSLKINV